MSKEPEFLTFSECLEQGIPCQALNSNMDFYDKIECFNEDVETNRDECNDVE